MFVQTEVKCNGWPFVEIILKAIGALQNCTLSGTKMHLNWYNENEIVPKLCKFSSKKNPIKMMIMANEMVTMCSITISFFLLFFTWINAIDSVLEKNSNDKKKNSHSIVVHIICCALTPFIPLNLNAFVKITSKCVFVWMWISVVICMVNYISFAFFGFHFVFAMYFPFI